VQPTFFETPEAFRAWLEANHETETELLVGFHKRGSGRLSMTWPESVDQALCFGWIDGVRRRIDDHSYSIRFTPRKPRSTWSRINVAKVAELTDRGLMQPAGLRAFERRTEENTGIYSFERGEEAQLPKEYERRLRANKKAATWFDAQPPSYRRTAKHWVISPKREETRKRRMTQLIECSAAGRAIPPLTRPTGENRRS
jgi:uncharacterized protein YdeI (YjbR/CyaY-like superfamily)